MNKIVYLLIGLVFFNCGGLEPRRPVEVKSGSFFKESIERSQRLLAQEQAQIQKIISQDTLHEYFTSSGGFSYHYEVKGDTLGYLPQTDDIVAMTYNVMTFENDTLYTSEQIGVKQLLVDKEQLFPGMRNAIKLMRSGERATFFFPSSLAYGYHGDGTKIAPATPIKSTVELLEIEKNSNDINQN